MKSKYLFNLFASLYLIAPLFVVPYLAYFYSDWYLLFGIIFSYFGGLWAFSPTSRNFIVLFLLSGIGIWFGFIYNSQPKLSFFFYCFFGGYLFAGLAVEFRQIVALKVLENEKNLQIFQSFEEFFEGGRILIPDKSQLLYSKQEIENALNNLHIEFTGFIAKPRYVNKLTSEEMNAMHETIHRIEFLKTQLADYGEILPEDKQRVDYFNSFYFQNEVEGLTPEEEQEFHALNLKYSRIRQNSL